MINNIFDSMKRLIGGQQQDEPGDSVCLVKLAEQLNRINDNGAIISRLNIAESPGSSTMFECTFSKDNNFPCKIMIDINKKIDRYIQVRVKVVYKTGEEYCHYSEMDDDKNINFYTNSAQVYDAEGYEQEVAEQSRKNIEAYAVDKIKDIIDEWVNDFETYKSTRRKNFEQNYL